MRWVSTSILNTASIRLNSYLLLNNSRLLPATCFRCTWDTIPGHYAHSQSQPRSLLACTTCSLDDAVLSSQQLCKTDSLEIIQIRRNIHIKYTFKKIRTNLPSPCNWKHHQLRSNNYQPTQFIKYNHIYIIIQIRRNIHIKYSFNTYESSKSM